MTNWLDELKQFATGQKKWDTAQIWVCESHSLMPCAGQGYSFDCDCGAPGMPPFSPENNKAGQSN